MLIKYPTLDNALKSLQNIVSFIERKFNNCINQRHDFITIIYISSLIISPNVVYKGCRLLRRIHDLIRFSPKNIVCLIRTTAPSVFPKRMKLLQEQAIEFLKDKCYIVIYSPTKEFLNHAKFFIYYHVCFSEGVIYHGKYYGSTNLTIAGLAFDRKSGHGNYEEYNISNPRTKLNLNKGDIFHLSEVFNLIVHKASLYIDTDYLRKYTNDHLLYLNKILQESHEVVSGTTLGELYQTYISLLVTYNQTYAFLDEVPGKKLTRKLKEKLAEIKPPISPFELEVMIPIDTEYAHLIAKMLTFQNATLRKEIKEYIDVLKEAHKIIKEKYLNILGNIEDYFDAKELDFLKFITHNSNYHKKIIKKLIASKIRRL